jgi:Ca2+-binding RTX toxin-like protein
MMSAGLVGAASGATVRVPPPIYPAATVEIDYLADPGESNRLTVSESAGTVVFADGGAPVALVGEPGGCVQHSASEVACAAPGAFDLGVKLGDGNDTAEIATALPRSAIVGGGPGRDVLVGGPARDVLSGGPGDDQLSGGGGDDQLGGDDGSDVLRGGGGNDDLAGGAYEDDGIADGAPDDLGGNAGEDSVTYAVSGRDAPVTVTLEGRRNDGPPGEADLVRSDIEDVYVFGDRGGNTVIGNSGPNKLFLNGGGTIVGGGGPDTLSGEARMLGGPGGDALEGEGVLLGGAGNDHITAEGRGRFDGGPGADRLDKDWPNDETPPDNPAQLFGGTGNDTIDAIDLWCDSSVSACDFAPGGWPVADTVACGPGRDKARLGKRDTARQDCERITSK